VKKKKEKGEEPSSTQRFERGGNLLLQGQGDKEKRKIRAPWPIGKKGRGDFIFL